MSFVSFRTLVLSTTLALVASLFVTNLAAQGRFKLDGTATQKATPTVATATAPSASASPSATPAVKPAVAEKVAELEKNLSKAREVKMQLSKELQEAEGKVAMLSSVLIIVSSVFLAVVIVIAVLVFLNYRMVKGKGKAVASMIALVMLAALTSPTYAASPVVRCAPNFFVNDGSTTPVSCTGVAKASAITFSDAAVTAANIKVAGGKITFDLTVGTGATVPSEPDMSVDGKKVGSPIGIVGATMAGQLDFTIRSIMANTGGNAGVDTHVRKVLEGLACPTADATCLKNFRAKAWGSKKGSSTQAGAELRTVIVTDPRHEVALEAALAAYTANLPASSATPASATPVTSVDLAPLASRIARVEQGQVALAEATDNLATVVRDQGRTTIVDRGGLFGHTRKSQLGTPETETRLVKAHCALWLAYHPGNPDKGCPGYGASTPPVTTGRAPMQPAR